MQDRFLTAYHQRMSGVMPTLKTHHALRVIGQPVDNFAFAFVTPLRADDHDIACRFVRHIRHPQAPLLSKRRHGVSIGDHIQRPPKFQHVPGAQE